MGIGPNGSPVVDFAMPLFYPRAGLKASISDFPEAILLRNGLILSKTKSDG